MSAPPSSPASRTPALTPRIGLLDAIMIVIGGIVGAGIFRNPHVVAQEVHSPALILGAWILGACIAMAGAFVYAELTAQRPAVGGQYAFFREVFHPALAFIYGWGLLLVVQTGGMAAVSVTFADYALKLTDALLGPGTRSLLNQLGDPVGVSASQCLAVIALAGLTVINCLGVKLGTLVQSLLTVLKMLAIGGLVLAGWLLAPAATGVAAATEIAANGDRNVFLALGAAMVPVLFAYGGWQTACFVAGEVKNPRRNLPIALLLGVLGVLLMYLGVSWVCLRVLGPAGLAATTTPAAEVIQRALGDRGSIFLSIGIVVSTLGFLSQGMLTAPRVYYAMARDGLFFQSLTRLHPVSHVPVAAIALQGVTAIIITLIGRYNEILNYVVSVDFVFYGLAGVCVFLYRRRAPVDDSGIPGGFRVPGHPWTTLFFVTCCWAVVVNSVITQPAQSLIGFGVLALGAPVYFLWHRRGSSV